MPAERRATFRARSLICLRTPSAPLSPSRERKEMTIVLPPVEPDLLRLGDGAKDHPNAHCEELDLGDRDANVAGDGKALVEHAVKNIDGAVGPMTGASLRAFPPRSRQRERNRRCRNVGANPVRRNIGPLDSMMAKHLPIQPSQAQRLMENGFCLAAGERHPG